MFPEEEEVVEEITEEEDLVEEVEEEFEEEDPVEESVSPEGKPDWKNRFSSPEQMYEEYKKAQSERDKLRAQKTSSGKTAPKSTQSEEVKSFLEQLQEDPEKAIDDLVAKRIKENVGPDMEFVANQRFQTVLSEVKKVFPDFDFKSEDNQKKLTTELENFSVAFRRDNPVEALMRAVKTVVGEKFSKEKVSQSIKEKKEAHATGVSKKAPKMPDEENDDIERVLNSANEKSVFM